VDPGEFPVAKTPEKVGFESFGGGYGELIVVVKASG
jgi:hypothetical protein